jgi:hypothetical protein
MNLPVKEDPLRASKMGSIEIEARSMARPKTQISSTRNNTQRLRSQATLKTTQVSDKPQAGDHSVTL